MKCSAYKSSKFWIFKLSMCLMSFLVIFMILMFEPFHIQFVSKKLEWRPGILKENTQHIIFNDFCGSFFKASQSRYNKLTSTSNTATKSTETFSCSKRRIRPFRRKLHCVSLQSFTLSRSNSISEKAFAHSHNML